MEKSTLNCPEIYRFIDLKMTKTVIDQFTSEGIKSVKTTRPGSKSLDIVVNATIDGHKLQLSPTLYTGKGFINLSLHKMMYSKNILTIANDIIYIISGDKLRAVWNDSSIVSTGRGYTDGIGEAANMSRVNIDWLISNSDYSFKLNDEIASAYDKDLAEIVK